MAMFDGKIVFVTSAAMGIGAATARLFAERGAYLILFGQDGTKGEAARAICFFASDVASFMTGSSLMVDGRYSAQ